MKKRIYDFIETGWFTATLFAVGALIGIGIGTGGFANLGDMSDAGAFATWGSTLIIGWVGALSSDFIRKRL